MTLDLLTNLLGVHRDGVAEAADELQHAGLIRYRRRHIDVLDRAGMGRTVCACYGVVKQEVDRLGRGSSQTLAP